MFGIKVDVVILFLSFALCSGQTVDVTKLWRIYMDMDNDQVGATTPLEDLTKPEVELFFFSMSSQPQGHGLVYPNFDYSWGTAYLDSPDVTLYFFNRWDQNNNNVLDLEDLDVMYETIDKFKTEPVSALSQINFENEFKPYFEQKWMDYPGNLSGHFHISQGHEEKPVDKVLKICQTYFFSVRHFPDLCEGININVNK